MTNFNELNTLSLCEELANNTDTIMALQESLDNSGKKKYNTFAELMEDLESDENNN